MNEKPSGLFPKNESSLPVICRIVGFKTKQKFHDKRSVSYTTVKHELKKYVKPFVSDKNIEHMFDVSPSTVDVIPVNANACTLSIYVKSYCGKA